MVTLSMLGARGVVGTKYGTFPGCGARLLSTSYTQPQRRDQQSVGVGVRGGCVLKPCMPLDQSLLARRFSQYEGSRGGGGSNKWLLAAGTTLASIAGGALFYTQTEQGRIWGDQAYKWIQDTLGLAPVPTIPTMMSISDKKTAKLEANNNEIMKTKPAPLPKQTPKDAKEADKSSDMKTNPAPLPTQTPTTASGYTPNEAEQSSEMKAKPPPLPTQSPKADEDTSNEADLRQRLEREIIDALKRQAVAYQENFDNNLNVMKSEYERRLQQQAKIIEAERVVELQAKYNKASAALAAIEQGIEARQEMNAKSQKLRKLWSSCNTLFSRVNYAQYYTIPGQEHEPITQAMINKKEMVQDFNQDEFASQLILSLPDKVTSFEALKQRFFNKLEPTCRKTMITKDGESLSLWKYFWGSVESALIARCDGERKTAKTTYEILDRTGFHLKHGDLLEATITLNTLSGLPRQIAKDWLDDARAVLETNQTLFTLMTYAASNNVY